MTQPAKSQEPSMEEILASIRRIIADDDATKTSQRPAEPPKPAAPSPRPEPKPAEVFARPPVEEPELPAAALDQAADILDLTESMAAPEFAEPEPEPEPAPLPSPAPPQFRRIDGYPDVSFTEPEQKAAAKDAEEVRANDERGQLLSSTTSAAVDSAFNTLAQTVLVQNARTLEDLVREMLRPMLKTWLDDNLPAMVERLVRNEIERVARGR